MLLAKTNTQRDGIRKHTLERPVRFGQVSLKFMMVGLLAAVALLYLAQSTQSASRTYELRHLEEERKDLLIEKERLEVESIRLRSLENLEQSFSTTPPKEEGQAAWEPAADMAYVHGARPVADRR